MFELDPASRDELDALDDDNLRAVVERVLADPSGRRQPQHSYTRRFRNPRRYVKVSFDETVWEFKPSRWRGLFVTVDSGDKKGLFFIPVKGKRFWSMSECPWH